MGSAATVDYREAGYREYSRGKWRQAMVNLPEETALTLFINGQEIITIMCTPEKLPCLVVGFMHYEGFIRGMEDIETMRISPDDAVADIRLTQKQVAFPKKRILNFGYGGRMSFQLGETLEPLHSSFSISPEQVLAAVQMLLHEGDKQGRKGRRKGMHRSVLTDGGKLLAAAEDIDRHNTIDKVWGECILRKIPTADKILVTTGRISSDMLIKAVKMSVPLVASLKSVTSLAVSLGSQLGITVIGYACGSRCSVFHDGKRLQGSTD